MLAWVGGSRSRLRNSLKKKVRVEGITTDAAEDTPWERHKKQARTSTRQSEHIGRKGKDQRTKGVSGQCIVLAKLGYMVLTFVSALQNRGRLGGRLTAASTMTIANSYLNILRNKIPIRMLKGKTIRHWMCCSLLRQLHGSDPHLPETRTSRLRLPLKIPVSTIPPTKMNILLAHMT